MNVKKERGFAPFLCLPGKRSRWSLLKIPTQLTKINQSPGVKYSF
jgi:hypothetical protein